MLATGNCSGSGAGVSPAGPGLLPGLVRPRARRPPHYLNSYRHGELAALIALAPVVFAAGCLVWALAVWAIEELG
jgi:hypothetical protein